MIKSFKCKETERIFKRKPIKKFAGELGRVALRKLLMIDATVTLKALRIPPGNRLEALKGKKTGQYSIRINNKWRICFVWKNGDAHDVEIVDYH